MSLLSEVNRWIDANSPIELKVWETYTLVETLPYLGLNKNDQITIIKIDWNIITLDFNWEEKNVMVSALQLALWYTWPIISITEDTVEEVKIVVSEIWKNT